VARVPGVQLGLVVLLATAFAGSALRTSPDGTAAVPSRQPPTRALAARYSSVDGRMPAGPACSAAAPRRADSTGLAHVARAIRPLIAYARPGRRPLARFGLVNVNRFPTIFGVLGEVRDTHCRVRWYRVQLPIRPNGAVGYVRARSVRVGAVSMRIRVDLSRRRLDVFSDGRRVLRVRTAVGAPRTPTPTGRYYVNQLVRAADPSGPWGPGGLGISAFSPVLVDWPQGGPIGIHGTNVPSSIGRASSSGCLRVENRMVAWLFRHVPAGTPVVITP
jgi:hypothetical protein